MLNYKTHVLDIDRWNGTGTTYPAKMSDALLVVTTALGEEATLNYDLYYDGDPVEGTVSFEGNVPTFTPTTSL